jgi:DNA-directed RNA polymerase specialized sigma24 family protein
MELSDLNQDERIALVGLMQMVVLSDANVSDEEMESVDELVDAFGEDGYQEALDAFEQRIPNEDAFKTFLRTITRQDARDLIFGTVLEGAGAEAVEDQEAEILDWLAKTWNVTVEIEDDESQA